MGSLRSMMRGLFYPERGVSMDKYRKMSERAEEGFGYLHPRVESAISQKIDISQFCAIRG